MKTSINITVKGRVQRVSYRYFTQQKAIELNIKGTVRNLENGDVFIVAEGTPSLVDQFLEWCYIGSPLAKVSAINVETGTPKDFKSFDILR